MFWMNVSVKKKCNLVSVWMSDKTHNMKIKNKCNSFWFFMFSLDIKIGNECVCLLLFHHEFYIMIWYEK